MMTTIEERKIKSQHAEHNFMELFRSTGPAKVVARYAYQSISAGREPPSERWPIAFEYTNGMFESFVDSLLRQNCSLIATENGFNAT